MLDIDYLIEQGFLNAADRSIVQHCESGAEAAQYVLTHCGCEDYRGA
jgi:hypothetical protein